MNRSVLLLAVLGLAACSPSGGGQADLPDNQMDLARLKPVTPVRALTMFDEVCGASLPDFARAQYNMVSRGVDFLTPTGTIYSKTEDINFKLMRAPRPVCSMVFATTASNDAVFRTFSQIGTFRNGPAGPAARYRSTNATALLHGTARQLGNRRYHGIKLLAAR